MNLNELRAKVKNITDYSPELVTYNEQLDLLINDAYMALWTEKRWKFAEKTIFLDIWPDIVATQPSGTVAACGVVNNRRRVVFNNPVHALDLPYIWEGQIFEVDSRDYTILKVVSNTEIHLDVPFRGTTLALNTSWKMKHRFYDIPKDAIELLYLGHRDTPAVGKRPPYGAVRGLLARRDEDWSLREDFTNFYSECYIPVGTANIPPAETLDLINGAADSGHFGSGEYFEVCWAFEGEGGKLGPLSESKILKSTASLLHPTSIVVAFKTWDNQPSAAPVFNPLIDQTVNQFEGLRKRIFFNQNFNRSTGSRLAGLPVWREVTYGSASATPGIPGLNTGDDPVRVDDQSSTFAILWPDQMGSGNKRYIEWEGEHFRFRPYPRPIGSDFTYLYSAGTVEPVTSDATERLFRQWECRYYRKPQQLALQTDQPELPYEFHNLIVYKALHDIFSKHDNFTQAATYSRKYADEIRRLEKRYVDSIDTTSVRQQFGIHGRIWSPYDPASLKRLN